MAPYAGAIRSADRRRRRDVNRPADPEAHGAGGGAPPLGTTRTEAGVHRVKMSPKLEEMIVGKAKNEK